MLVRVLSKTSVPLNLKAVVYEVGDWKRYKVQMWTWWFLLYLDKGFYPAGCVWLVRFLVGSSVWIRGEA